MSSIQVPGFPLVPGVGDHLAAAAGEFEPQRASNFTLLIDGISGSDLLQLSLDALAAPSMSVEEIALPFDNENRYVAGRALYDTTPMVVKDMVDVGSADAIWAWYTQVYDPTTHKIGLARDYKKTATLVMYSPEGSFSRQWIYFGMFPTAVNWGGYAKGTSDYVKLEITLRYDRCVYGGSSRDAGIGGLIGNISNIIGNIGGGLGAAQRALGSLGGLF